MAGLVKYTPRKTWSPVTNFIDMHRDIDTLFDSLFGSRDVDMWQEGAWSPAVDIYENDNHFTLKAELPGMKEKDITVNIEGNTLTIQGERKEEKETKEGQYRKLERCFGTFCRSFQLPSNVKADKIKAHYKNGMLEIELPKAEESKPKRIEVKVDK